VLKDNNERTKLKEIQKKMEKKIPRGNLYLRLAIHEPKRRDDF
jgi:hypothetical protein